MNFPDFYKDFKNRHCSRIYVDKTLWVVTRSRIFFGYAMFIDFQWRESKSWNCNYDFIRDIWRRAMKHEICFCIIGCLDYGHQCIILLSWFVIILVYFSTLHNKYYKDQRTIDHYLNFFLSLAKICFSFINNKLGIFLFDILWIMRFKSLAPMQLL